MAIRYVRVRAREGKIHYGILQIDRTVQILDAPPWLQGQQTEQLLEPDSYQLLAPCSPSKILAVGKNYAAHAAEMQSDVPPEPLLFLKPRSAIVAHQDPILYPKQSSRVDYEGELALVIGDRCTQCSPEEAQQKIWGYTVANDVTARDLQRASVGPWAMAKGFDSFCPVGPWIVREIATGALIQTFINESEGPAQKASIEDMVYKPSVLVSYISQIMTLVPGDLILTGTPEGVGPVQVGDRIRIEIEGIGCLENPVIARPS